MYDETYNYKIISNYEFDTKLLACNKDGNKYRKYILLVLNENGIKRYKEVPDLINLNKFTNLVSYYHIEEIISSCNNFDSIFAYAHYYRIKNKICFIKQ